MAGMSTRMTDAGALDVTSHCMPSLGEDEAMSAIPYADRLAATARPACVAANV
jgi:hypothetical protein